MCVKKRGIISTYCHPDAHRESMWPHHVVAPMRLQWVNKETRSLVKVGLPRLSKDVFSNTWRTLYIMYAFLCLHTLPRCKNKMYNWKSGLKQIGLKNINYLRFFFLSFLLFIYFFMLLLKKKSENGWDIPGKIISESKKKKNKRKNFLKSKLLQGDIFHRYFDLKKKNTTTSSHIKI